MRGKTPNHAGFFQGPVKLADIVRTDMYRDYLTQIKKGDRLLFTFPYLPTAATALDKKTHKKHP